MKVKMLRKASDATKPRNVRGDLAFEQDKNRNQRALLDQMRATGNGMSNICFNLSQDKAIEERHRDTMRRCYKDWDAILGEMRHVG